MPRDSRSKPVRGETACGLDAKHASGGGVANRPPSTGGIIGDNLNPVSAERQKLIERLAQVYGRLTPGAIETADLDGMAFTVRDAMDALSATPRSDAANLDMVERAARAVADACYVDLSGAILEAGGITNAIAVFGMDGLSDDLRFKDWRMPSCRGVIKTARAVLASLTPLQNEDDGYRAAVNLATILWEKHFRDNAPNWRPLDDVAGVISQIDNMTASMTPLPNGRTYADGVEAAAAIVRRRADEAEGDGTADAMSLANIIWLEITELAPSPSQEIK